jgi:translation initiation factor 4B
LNLAKRTVTEADLSSPSAADSKASPFGAARPIDTAAKEREIEEKRLAALKEKKDAEEKAKEEREAAKAKAAEEAAAAEEEKKVEILKREDGTEAAEGETVETENANSKIVDDKAVKPKEVVRDARPKPSDTGAWRRPTNGPLPTRDDVPRGPRGRGGRGRGEGRGGRGGHDGEGRGARQYDNEGRLQRQNTNTSTTTGPPPQSPAVEKSETAALEEDGWSTVSKPKKNTRGGSRAIAS